MTGVPPAGEETSGMNSAGHDNSGDSSLAELRDQPSAESGGEVRILVVDDDEAVRQSTAAILRHAGFEVLEAGDGTAATWVLASETIDVLLLDLHLGHLDGTAVLDALEESSTVVIFSAFGYFNESDIRRDFGTVVFETLHKPVAPDLLVKVLTKAAAHSRGLGREATVRPISPRMALGLAMAGLSRMTPQTERNEHPSTTADDPASGGRP
jgi:DNA-binding response OmpR family regulator